MTYVHGWHTEQLDYVAVFPQGSVERELYIKITKCVNLQGKISCDHVLKLHRNTYDQKNGGRVCNHYLVKKLEIIYFKHSKIDKRVFYKGKVKYSLYKDESILERLDPDEIYDILKLMIKAKLDITE